MRAARARAWITDAAFAVAFAVIACFLQLDELFEKFDQFFEGETK